LRASCPGQACVGRALSALEDELGDLDLVERVLFLRGFLNAAPDYCHHSVVLDAVSAALRTAFGESGGHARSAVGVAELPNDYPVEIEAIVELREGD